LRRYVALCAAFNLAEKRFGALYKKSAHDRFGIVFCAFAIFFMENLRFYMRILQRGGLRGTPFNKGVYARRGVFMGITFGGIK
jgi:hypothetical protein